MAKPDPVADSWIRRYLSDVATKIRDRRMAMGLTQNQVAAHLDWSRPKLAAIEAGKQALTVEQLVLLASLLRCGPWDFLPFFFSNKEEARTADKLKALPPRKRPRRRAARRPPGLGD